MSNLQSEGQYVSDWLKWEVEGSLYSRKVVTIKAGSGSDRVLTSGMVLGKITSGGKYVQIDGSASDGSQTAAGILLLNTTAPDGEDVEATIINSEAVVSHTGLTWPSGFNTTTGEASLLALGIKTREAA